MKKIENIKNCYGCGVCAATCKHDVIDLSKNEDGFFQPVIKNPNACVGCGLCESVCAYINPCEYRKPIESYACWSLDDSVREKSTSGGVCFEISRHMLSSGYKICGVKYNTNKNRAEHDIATNIEELLNFQGSKYLQSFTLDAFRRLSRTDNNVVIGTPCQIASLRKYVEKFKCSENYVFIDFFCHGVPSYLLWEKYLNEHKKSLGKINSVSWRSKEKGWRSSYCITIDGSDGQYKSWKGSDEFFSFFLGDACLNKACYGNCKFKYDKSCADIRIGDFWGSLYRNESQGVNAVIVLTTKGRDILNGTPNLKLTIHSFEEATQGQSQTNASKPVYYSISNAILRHNSYNLRKLGQIIEYIKMIESYLYRIKNTLK